MSDMSPKIQAAVERLKRVKAGEAKPVVYPHPNPDEVHEMVRVGHAEFSHYNDLVFMADVAMATLPGIAELSLKAARWDECERLSVESHVAFIDKETGHHFRPRSWRIDPIPGESFAAAIDASIEQRAKETTDQ